MSTSGTPGPSPSRRLSQKVVGPVASYVDRMFAGVHHRLDEVFLEVSRGREDVSSLRAAVGDEVDVLHEVVLGLERQVADLAARIDALDARTPDTDSAVAPDADD